MRTQLIVLLILVCLVAAPVSAQDTRTPDASFDAAEIDLFTWDYCQHEWQVDVATQAAVVGVSVHWQPDMAAVGPWQPSVWDSGLRLVPQPGSQFPVTLYLPGPAEADYDWLTQTVLCTHYNYFAYFRICDMTPELVCNSAPLPAKGEADGR